MNKYLLLLITVMVLVACGNTEDVKDEVKELRDEMILNKNENINITIATDSLFNVWDIEDFLIEEKEEINKNILFEYTDEYIMDEDVFESLNGYEKGLVMKTSVIISKFLKGNYFEDDELFEKDLEKYYDILQNGDDIFID